MKSKNLALTNGIVGLVGGIILLFGIWFLLGSAAGDASTVSAMAVFLNGLKIAILVLGIYGAVYYKESAEVKSAPNVLLIVGGGIALIPFLGWVGGILAIIGGSLYLASLKNFK
ncbi:hypothetical protein FC48_GL001612 [Ligilactobacillus murinus DSM 20452 = NBRC 14221]|uniref:Prophage Lp1 protein 6 n=1 Tax=Ligilactobacillus murinus DSM 20452 = NBRC 14221 TaxID=1423772 RepID=A0A0R2BK04_9LACO|nr:hypothetical protein [Ligilactobacillus murinus]KRM78100.1 hypothetical protein FC48_GL001612 [Ligilactobacillus murinus DSM 20452 = NBRC 14221]